MPTVHADNGTLQSMKQWHTAVSAAVAPPQGCINCSCQVMAAITDHQVSKGDIKAPCFAFQHVVKMLKTDLHVDINQKSLNVTGCHVVGKTDLKAEAHPEEDQMEWTTTGYTKALMKSEYST